MDIHVPSFTHISLTNGIFIKISYLELVIHFTRKVKALAAIYIWTKYELLEFHQHQCNSHVNKTNTLHHRTFQVKTFSEKNTKLPKNQNGSLSVFVFREFPP